MKLDEVTVGGTCFFRSMPQLDALREAALPKIMTAKVKIPCLRLKLWSCGCSTGEEPYTLAMLLMEHSATALKGWTWEINATDLNARSLAKAKESIYDTYSRAILPPSFSRSIFSHKTKNSQSRKK